MSSSLSAVAKKLLPLLLSTLVTGCASYATISNQQLAETAAVKAYGLRDEKLGSGDRDLSLVLAFSGGGTRAAALSYGVLLGLRNSRVQHHGRAIRLLDEISMISSVSGGSFTSAYYGLHGEQIFDDFETKFLRRDVGSALIDRLLSPRTWFSPKSRSEEAVSIYEDTVFDGATFADLKASGGPLVVINATDLGKGVRFSFIQEYFNLLCSDLASFPIARAVTASSAVPVLFAPVVLENHSGCDVASEAYLQKIDTANLPAQVSQVVDGLKTYADKEQRKYIHLVDGGITDNLGLMAIYEMVGVAGGIKSLHQVLSGKPAKNVVLISVNASTHVKHEMELSREEPSLEDTINTMTDVQLHRYNAASVDLMKGALQSWADELSTPEQPITPHFIEISFDSLPKPQRDYVNAIPTALTLNDEQVDHLIELGQRLLYDNPEFQRFINSYQE